MLKTLSHAWKLATLAAIAAVILPAQTSSPAVVPSGDAGTPQSALAQQKYLHLPLAFERQQDVKGERYVARGQGYAVAVQGASATIGVVPENGKPARSISLDFVGGHPAKSVPETLLPGKVNYITGNDPAKWQLGLSTYEKLRIPAIYRGIDVVYYGNQQQLEFDLVVKPGSDPGAIRMKVGGGEKLSVDATGSLVIGEADGDLRIALPAIYQEVDGVRKNIPGRYTIRGGNEVAFNVASYDRAKPLVIDPTIVYSALLGGGLSSNYGYAIKVDGSGNILVAGPTFAGDFPTLNPAQSKRIGTQYTGFVTKINAAGTALVYSTYLGGSTYDIPQGLAVDSAGSAWVTGYTESTDFPVLNAAQSIFGAGGYDAFVAKLNGSGVLQFSTFLGGSSQDIGTGVTVDPSGNGYATGYSQGPFPTTAGALQPTNQGYDAYVVKYGPTGTVLFSTLLGGTGSDFGYAIAADSSGNSYLTGYSTSSAFSNAPGGGAQTTNNGGGADAFVAKLNSTGTGLLYFTFLGGAGYDWGKSIAIDASLNAYIAGQTSSAGLATAGAAQTAWGGGYDGFVAKLNAAGTSFNYVTYLGGSRQDYASGIAVDGGGNAYVTGYTDSPGFPTASPVQATFPGNSISLFSSINSGATWSALDSNVPGAVFDISLNPAGTSAVVATELGIYRTVNGGASWTQQSSAAATLLSRDPITPTTIYAVVCCTVVYQSTDDGISWNFKGSNSAQARGIVADTATSGTLYLWSVTAPYVYVSTNSGATWAPAVTGLPNSAVNSMVTTVDGAVYAGTQSSGIYKSTNHGSSWTAVTGLPANLAVPNRSLSASGNTVYFGNGTIYVTSNGGTSWQSTPTTVGAVQVAASPQNPSILYALDFSNVIQKSTDGGSTWVAGTGLSPFVGVGYQLTVDPGNSAHPLVVATVNQVAFATKLNSTGTSLSWSTFLGGTGTTAGYAIAADGAGNAFVTGETSSNLGFPVTSTALPSGTSSQAFISKISDTTAACSVTVSPGSQIVSLFAQVATFSVVAPSGCAWTVSTNQSWAVVTSGTSGTGSGIVTVQTANNLSGATQVAVLTVGGQNVTITQPANSCTFSLNLGSYPVSAAGGSVSATLTTATGCPWQVTNNYSSAITLTSASSGTGSGTIGLNVAANPSIGSRSFRLSVGTTSISILQASGPPVVSTTAVPAGTLGSAYSTTLAATGGIAPYSGWTLASGSLPAGVTLNASTGVISGTPTASTGSPFNFAVIVSDSTGTASAFRALSLVVSPAVASTLVYPGQSEVLTSSRNAAVAPLLFAYASNSGSAFDTEFTISNTSLDTHGSTPQSGTCKVSYYGQNAPAAQTSSSIAAGQQLVFTLSRGGGGLAGAPNFTGYVIAGCTFPMARGTARLFAAGIYSASQAAQVLSLPRSLPATQAFLIPYVATVTGYDMAIAFSNTGSDPFGASGAGATATSGSCVINFYGSGAPASPYVTPTIAPGSTYAGLVSNMAPGFTGYLIANCGFGAAASYSFWTYEPGTLNSIFTPVTPEPLTLPRTAPTQSLLFPVVTNQAGDNTGIAIANTSSDPFGSSGATPQSGTCTLNFYGSNAPASTVTTPTIAPGTVYTNVLSSLAPGFQGYITASCTFGPVRGYTYVSTPVPHNTFSVMPELLTLPRNNAATSSLLFAGLSNQNANDTAIFISNTSQDSFGSAAGSGTCLVSYFGSMSGGGSVPTPQTSANVLAGGQIAFTLSQGGAGLAGAPGFRGYAIADCAFPLARGVAAIAGTPDYPVITTTSLPAGTAGTSYSQVLAASGIAPYHNWAVASGTLPTGLTLNASTGFISGIPTTASGSPFGFTVTVQDAAGNTSPAASLSIAVTAATVPVVSSITNTADGTLPPLAPGSLATITGTNLASTTATASGTPAPFALAGVGITVNGTPAAILSVSPTAVNFQVPYEVSIGSSASVVVTNSGSVSTALTFSVLPASPGILPQIYNATGGALACAQFPVGFTPFSSVYYVTGQNGPGDRLLVGSATLANYSQINSLPLPAFSNQQYCGGVTLANGYTVTAYVPTAAERAGNFSSFAGLLIDPAANFPFPGGVIPPSRLADPFAWRIAGQAAGAVNSAANPVAPGATASVYFTGGGAVSPGVADGAAGPSSPTSTLVAAASVTVAGQSATTTPIGLAPGFVGFDETDVTIPAGLTAGAYSVVVTANARPSRGATIYVSGAAPTAATVTPNSTPQFSPAMPVTISGANFGGGSLVLFTPPGGTASALIPTQLQAAQIAATIPASLMTTAGTAQIAVQNGLGTVTNQLPFTITAAVVPALTSVTPASIPAYSPATPITIAGSNFGAASVISFTPPGGATTTFTPSSIQAAQLAATIPAAYLTTAGTAQVSVQNGAAFSSGQLPLTITGAASTATALTVSGTSVSNFGQGVTLTATVSPSVSGSVTFYGGTTMLGSGVLSNGIATLTTSLLPSGTASLRARYLGSAGNAPSLSPAVTHRIVALPSNGFATRVNYSGGANPRYFAQGDFNGDGKMDLAVTYLGGTGVGIYLGNGDGTFQAAVNYATGSTPYSLVAADFNGDGKTDLAVANEGNSIGILMGNGDGTFQSAVNTTLSTTPTTIIAADFNGDGRVDLAVTTFGSDQIAIMLGHGDGTFGSPSKGGVGGGGPISVVAGDFNGDGIVDLATANSNTNNVGVLLGNGDGTFQAALLYTTGAQPYSIASADLNGDGKADLVTANTSGNSLSVLLGNGDGTFVSAVNYPTTTGARMVAIGDIDGDGRPDLAVAENGGNTVFVHLGNGDGTFQTGVGYTSDLTTTAVAIGDFNADGRADLVVANYNAANISVLLGVPAALSTVTSVTPNTAPAHSLATAITIAGTNFGPASVVSFTTPGGTAIAITPSQIQAAQIAATIPAALLSTAGTAQVAIQYGSGALSNQVPFTITAAVAPTVSSVTPNTVQAYSSATAITIAGSNFGTASVVSFTPPGGTATTLIPTQIQAAQISVTIPGVYLAPAGTAQVSVQNGPGLASGQVPFTITPPTSTTTALSVSGAGPFNFGQSVTLTATVTPTSAPGSVTFFNGTTLLGSGALSNGTALLTTRLLPSGTASLRARYVGGGGYTPSASAAVLRTIIAVPSNGFAAPVGYGSGNGGPSSTASGDFNGDGKIDLAITNYTNNTVGIFLGNGDGTFQTALNYPTGVSPYSVAVGDFNGDGKQDLVIANWDNNSADTGVSVLLGNGNGTFQTAVNYNTGGAPISVAVADFNGDGRADLVVVNNGGGVINVAVLLGNGDGTFQAEVSYTAGFPSSIAVGDFNGDGIADLVTANSGGFNASILLGLGDGTFGTASNYPTGNFPKSVAIGDFNGDGKTDFATANNVGTVSVFLGNGDGTFQSAATYAVGSSPNGIAAGDFNGDGRTDLFVANSGGSVSVLAGVGDGTFLAAVNYASGNGQSVVVGDFNGDGRSDLAVANSGSTSVSILLGVLIPIPTVTSVTPNTAPAHSPATAVTIAGTNFGPTSVALFINPGGVATPITTSQIQAAQIAATIPASLLTTAGTAQIAIQNGVGISSNQVPFTITPATATTATTLTSSRNPANYGQPVTLTATVSPSSATGTVTFKDGSAVLGTVNAVNGQATLTLSTLASGTHSLSANYNGDANDNTSFGLLSQNVNVATPSIGLVTSANPAIFGQFVTLTAAVSPNIATGTVTFSDGATTLGTSSISSGLGKLVVSTLSTGVHSLTASYGGDSNDASGTSGILTETVVQPTIVTTTTLASSLNPSKFGQSVTLTATVSPSGAAGNVTFYDGTTVLGTTALSGGHASLTTKLLAYGARSLRAYFAPGATDLASTSATLPQVVGATPIRATGFGAGTTYSAGPVGSTAEGVTMGDFNGDNIADLAVASYSSSTVSVFLGRGDGSFGSAVTYPVLSTIAFAAVVGDFNGDGKADLVVGSSMLLGNGDGTFQAALSLSGGANQIAVGDFNGDGKTDLTNGSTLFLGNGDGTVHTGSTTGIGGYGVAAGDFNGDGRLDLAITDNSANTVNVELGNGDGTFQPAIGYPTGQAPRDVAVGDFNGDGFADLAIANNISNSLTVMLGNGNGTFQAGVTYAVSGAFVWHVAASDVDGDGKLDLIVGGGLNVLLGNGDGTFQTPVIYPISGFGSVVVGDFNGDGALDIAASSSGLTILLAPTSLQSQTITFGALTNQILGTSPVLSGSASSGLGVTFTSNATAVCTVSGSTVTLLTAGTCSITASQPGNSTYAPAASITQTFTVTALTAQTITFAQPADTAFTAGPVALSGSSTSGLAVTYTSNSTGVCTVSGSSITLVAAGSCSITANQPGNGSYAAATAVTRAFTVLQGAQTITFGLLNAVASGAAPFGVTATASSGLPVSFTSTTTPVCTVSATTVTIAAPGVCSITASQAGNANYAPAASVVQSFSVVTNTSQPSLTIGAATGGAGQTVTLSVPLHGAGVQIGAVQFDVSFDATALTLSAATGSAAVAANKSLASSPLAGGKRIVVAGLSQTTIADGSIADLTIAIAGSAPLGTYPLTISNVSGADLNGQTVALTGFSGSVTVATLTAQSVTFDPLSNLTWGAAPFSLTGTASSGLTVTFGSTTPAVCTVTGTTVTIVASGSCSITASQAGNAVFAPAPTVTRSFAVNPAAQTIVFGALANQTVSAAPFTVSATASSGLPVSFTSTTTAVCTVSGATVTLLTSGACSILASQPGNNNYSAASPVSQTFTVLALQTITFPAPANVTFGVSPLTVTATASSSLTVTLTSNTTSVCTVSGSTVTIAAAGTCSITASQPGNNIYTAATPVVQSFTVGKGAQTITFAQPPDTASSAGQVTLTATSGSGLAVSFTSTSQSVCTVSGSSVTLLTTGTCSVVASQAGNGNYNAAASVTKTFNVTGPPNVITFPHPADTPLTAGPVSLTATATSGLAVSYTSTSTGVCTVSGSGVTLVAVGTCFITANQAGNGTYPAATAVNIAFNVLQGVQTITFSPPPDMALSAGPVTLTATATSSLAVSFTGNSSAVCTVSGASVTLVAVGTCSITASQAGNANFSGATPVTRTFAITQAVATPTVSLAVGDGSGAAGSIVEIPITLTSTGTPALTTFQLDLSFDQTKLTFQSARSSTLTDTAHKDISNNTQPNGDVRLLVSGTNQTVIPNGIVAYASFTLSTPFTAASTITPKGCVSANGQGTILGTACTVGTIHPLSCDINADGTTNVADVQLIINEALGVSPPVHDLNHDGAVNVADVQKVINAALGLGCSAQ